MKRAFWIENVDQKMSAMLDSHDAIFLDSELLHKLTLAAYGYQVDADLSFTIFID